MSVFQIFDHRSVLRQHPFYPASQQTQVIALGMGLLNLIQSLSNGTQLFVSIQASPEKGFPTPLIDRISDRLPEVGLNLDQLRISAQSGSIERGGSVSAVCC